MWYSLHDHQRKVNHMDLSVKSSLPTSNLRNHYFWSCSFRVLLLCPGNPLRCQCEQQELWYWLQDHQRQVDRGPRCEGPPQLRGLWFLGLEPPEFCSLPLVPRLHLDRILASSLGVSWDSQNNSGVTAFAVAYHTLESPSKVRSQHYFQQMLSINFNLIQ